MLVLQARKVIKMRRRVWNGNVYKVTWETETLTLHANNEDGARRVAMRQLKEIYGSEVKANKVSVQFDHSDYVTDSNDWLSK
jgi:hypothetical protein